MGLYQSVGPTADFIIEAIKLLNEDDLVRVSQAVDDRLKVRKVIDLPPLEEEEAPAQQASTGSILDLLTIDNIRQVMQIINKFSSNDPNQKSILSSFLNPQFLSFLPKLISAGQEAFNASAPEDELFSFLSSYLPSSRQSQFQSIQPFFKFYRIMNRMGFDPSKPLRRLRKNLRRRFR